MPVQTTTYWVHQDAGPFLFALMIGAVIVLGGTLRWGRRFGFIATVLGLLIPAAQFLLVPKAWRSSGQLT